MNKHRLKTMAVAALLAAGSLMGAGGIQANTVDAVLKVGQDKTQAAQASQKTIDNLAGETSDLLQDYKTVMKQVDGLRVYNNRLEKQIQNQNERITTIDESIEQVTVIQRQITPLVLEMIAALESFIAMDMPFEIEERQKNLAILKRSVDRSDVSVAEKFRQVLEAYKIENEYGRTVEASKGSVSISGVDREVNFFRVGRIALLYQTTDTEVTGMWDKSARAWVEVDKGTYRSAVMTGLRIARDQATKDILKLPIAAPEAAK